MKKSIMIMLIVAAVLVLVSCGKAGIVEIEGMDGNTVEVSTQGMTNDQIKALEDVASGDSNIMELLRSGLFTPEEITNLGFNTVGKASQAGEMRGMDFSDIALEDLDLDGLSQEQIDVIEQIISGEITPQEATQDGVLSMEDLVGAGLVDKMPQENAQRGKPAN